MPDPEEQLEVINEKGEVVRLALRSEIHGNPSLIHRVVHVLVFNEDGALLLQKRSLNKDVAPGKWDTSVGGHVGIGEELTVSAKREMEEELGIADCGIEYLYSYIHRDACETELVTTYRCIYSGLIRHSREEIDEVRFWRLEEISEAMGKGILSGHFEDELKMYLNHIKSKSAYAAKNFL
jgi:isopentenyldiphosphate isomerase